MEILREELEDIKRARKNIWENKWKPGEERINARDSLQKPVRMCFVKTWNGSAPDTCCSIHLMGFSESNRSKFVRVKTKELCIFHSKPKCLYFGVTAKTRTFKKTKQNKTHLLLPNPFRGHFYPHKVKTGLWFLHFFFLKNGFNSLKPAPENIN